MAAQTVDSTEDLIERCADHLEEIYEDIKVWPWTHQERETYTLAYECRLWLAVRGHDVEPGEPPF